MRIYIPEIGDELILTKDWSFKLVLERRNKGLLEIMFPDFEYDRYSFYDWSILELWPDSKGNIIMTKKLGEKRNGLNDNWKNGNRLDDLKYFFRDNRKDFLLGNEMPNFIMPKGTVLKLARIYIKSASSEYSSLSFWAKLPNIKKKIRFFAQLKDVNNIEYEQK